MFAVSCSTRDNVLRYDATQQPVTQDSPMNGQTKRNRRCKRRPLAELAYDPAVLAQNLKELGACCTESRDKLLATLGIQTPAPQRAKVRR
jgi:hypothetical protein